jgi:hypothetical protein
MRHLGRLVIIISFFFLLAQADNKKSNQDHPEPAQTNEDSDISDEPSKRLMGLLFRICELVDKINSAGLSVDEASQARSDISELLNKAVSYESDDKVKHYFSSLSQDMAENDFHLSNASWRALENRTGNLIIQYHEDQKKIDCFILKKHHAWTEKASKYLALVEKMKSNSTMKFNRSSIPVTIVYPFVIADLVGASGINRLSFLHPPDVAGQKTGPSRIIILRNLARLFFDRILKPVASRSLGGGVVKYVRFESYLSNLIMHKIAHFLGPYVVVTKSEEVTLVNSKLGDLFNCIDEIKADTVAMCNTEVLIKAKLISRKHEKRIFTTYIAQLLEKLRFEPESQSRLPYLIQVNFLLKNDGIVYNVDSHNIIIDFDKLKENLKKLMSMVVKIQQDGNHVGAKQLIKEFTVISEALKRINDKMTDLSSAINVEDINPEKSGEGN